MALKQQNRLLNLNTALGDDVLLLRSFSGHEEIGRLFTYQLEMISDDPGIKPQDLVGTPVGWSIELSDNSRRHWHGFVKSLSRGDVDREDRRNYRVEVVPWLWFLTQTSDCKIFQEKKVPDIIEEVLGDYGFADFKSDFQLDHKDWEYCVQYRETDFNFLCRLFEQEGIFYYFEHSEGAHKMVITDHKDGYSTLPESTVDFPDDVGSRAIEDHLTSWERKFQFVPGKWAQRDYNFKTPSDDLGTDTNTVVDLPEINNYEIFDYPGEYPDKGVGDGETRLRIEAEEARHDIVSATSLCKTFQAGGRFTVGQHRDGEEEGAEVVITSIQHMASEPMSYETGSDNGMIYGNTLTCVPASRVFRTTRSTAKPIISGVQTAVVTGPAGEEIYPDEFGRVKCQFHWDRYGEHDDKSSCWIRVSQVHAGTGFGGISIPRIGEEVVVSFVEGDPDRPLITGRVYHAMNQVPYELPANKTQSGIKTRSSMGGGPDNFNEIRFEDKMGEEEMYIHAEKDQNIMVENDRGEEIGRDRSLEVHRHKYETVHGKKQIQVDLDHQETIDGSMTVGVGKNLVETVAVNYMETVGAAMQLTVGGALAVSVGAATAMSTGGALSESVGGSKSENVGQSKTVDVGESVSESVGENQNVKIGKDLIEAIQGKHREEVKKEYMLQAAKIQLVADNEISIKTGKAEIVMKKNGDITIKGKKISVKGSGNVVIKGSKIAEN